MALFLGEPPSEMDEEKAGELLLGMMFDVRVYCGGLFAVLFFFGKWPNDTEEEKDECGGEPE